MGFKEWLSGLLNGNKEVVKVEDLVNYVNKYEVRQLAIEEFAIHTAINMIAGAISKCEIRTFENQALIKGEEYYLWNYEPNKNQNSSEFIHELIFKLLYKNECLVLDINGDLIVCDNWIREKNLLTEDIFKNVSRDSFTFKESFFMSDVMYFKLNNSNIKLLIDNLCTGYDNILSEAIKKYELAGGKKGIIEVETMAGGQKKFEKELEVLMNNHLKDFFKSKNAVLPLTQGYKYTDLSNERSSNKRSEIQDITSLANETFTRVAQGFHMPPSLLNGEIADLKEITKNFITFSVSPICNAIKKEINRKRYGKREIIDGSYLDIDISNINYSDIFDLASNIDKLIASGLFTVNEARAKLNEPQVDDDIANRRYITKNYEELTKGGDVKDEE